MTFVFTLLPHFCISGRIEIADSWSNLRDQIQTTGRGSRSHGGEQTVRDHRWLSQPYSCRDSYFLADYEQKKPISEGGDSINKRISEEKAQQVVPGWECPEILSRLPERSMSLTWEWADWERGSRLQTATPILSPWRLHTPSQKNTQKWPLRKKMKILAGQRLLANRLQRCFPSTFCGSHILMGSQKIYWMK